jgi:PAS domain S-box-containing protein
LRSAQEALQRNEERYRTLFENTGAATVLLDENTIISLANAEFVRLSGFSRDELEGKKRWTEFVVPEDLERMLAQHRMRRVKKQAALQHYEFRFRTRSGEIRHISLTIDVIPGTTKSVASLMDVTENIRSQEALSRANRKLNLMSSITRHDVLNQLTSLFGFLQLVERRVTDPEVKQFLVREKQAAESIRAQIEFTRDYQDIGGQSPEWQRVQETIRKAAEMIPLKEIVLTTDVPMVEIYADHLLVKVFYTLVENAIRHGEHVTKIRIFSEQSDNELRIIFEDDGVGVPEDAKQMIFQRKYFQNTGLGLFLSQEILSITGLSITETGISSQGARFVIHVPRGAFRITDSQNHTV